MADANNTHLEVSRNSNSRVHSKKLSKKSEQNVSGNNSSNSKGNANNNASRLTKNATKSENVRNVNKEKDLPSITIDGKEFILVCKSKLEGRELVLLKTYKQETKSHRTKRNKPLKAKWTYIPAYASISTGHYFKYMKIKENGVLEKGKDYVVDTNLHINLQKFINENLENLEECKPEYEPIFKKQIVSFKLQKNKTNNSNNNGHIL